VGGMDLEKGTTSLIKKKKKKKKAALVSLCLLAGKHPIFQWSLILIGHKGIAEANNHRAYHDRVKEFIAVFVLSYGLALFESAQWIR